MKKNEVINQVIENLEWENMYLHIWETDQDGEYRTEIINQDTVYGEFAKGHLGRINLSSCYWDQLDEMRENKEYMAEVITDAVKSII